MRVCFEYLSLLFGDTELFSGLKLGWLWHIVGKIFIVCLSGETLVFEAPFEFY